MEGVPVDHLPVEFRQLPRLGRYTSPPFTFLPFLFPYPSLVLIQVCVCVSVTRHAVGRMPMMIYVDVCGFMRICMWIYVCVYVDVCVCIWMYVDVCGCMWI